MASGTLSNPECNSHLSLLNVITVTFNVAVTVKIVVPASLHEDCTLNRPRGAALGAIELEIPAVTAVVTAANPEVAGKIDMEGSVCVLLHEFTLLYNKHKSHTLPKLDTIKAIICGFILIKKRREGKFTLELA